MAANINIYVASTVAAGVLANSRRHAASFKPSFGLKPKLRTSFSET